MGCFCGEEGWVSVSSLSHELPMTVTDTFIVQIQGGVLLCVGEGVPVRTLWRDGCHGRYFARNGGQDHCPPGVILKFCT